MRVVIVRCALWIVLSILAGCGGADPAGAGRADSASATDSTAAADATALYRRSCFACHSSGAGGAPRTGDRAAWQWRLEEKGLDGLVASAFEGVGSMPPGGLCGQCSAEDYRALILLMAAP